VTTVAHHGRSPAYLAPRPSWGDAFAAAILGWVIASVLLLVPVLLALWLGLAGRSGTVGLGGGGLRDWPYPRNGDLSLAANLVVWGAIFALTALLVRGMLADRVGPVSAVPIFAVLAVTGFAPFVPHGLLQMPLPVAFVLSAWLIRVVVATTPIRPLPKQVTARLIAVSALLLAVPAWYGLTHPLWLGSLVAYESDPPARSALGHHTFSLKNAGFADARVEGVALRADVPVVELVGVRADREPPLPPGSPALALTDAAPPPFTIPGRGESFVQLLLRGRGCGGPVRATAVVRYSLLGSPRVAAVPLRLPVRACAGG
jgi:hypothetical protein